MPSKLGLRRNLKPRPRSALFQRPINVRIIDMAQKHLFIRAKRAACQSEPSAYDNSSYCYMKGVSIRAAAFAFGLVEVFGFNVIASWSSR